MKKIIFILLISVIFNTNIFACLCTPFISASFTSSATSFSGFLQAQASSLQILKQSIEKVNTNIKEQNKLLDKENNLLQDEAVRDNELIFYLKQKNQLR